MSRLANALTTFRYWNSINRVCNERTPAIDRAKMFARLEAIRPDAAVVLKALKNQGIAVIPNYWPADKCVAARAEIDRLIEAYPDAVRRFSGGADKRMFGVESDSDLLSVFHHVPFTKGCGELYGGYELINFATLGARIDMHPDNLGSGEGWHRDGFGFQYKSILYLSDVTEENGPFEYLSGSNRLWRTALNVLRADLPPPPMSRFAAEQIDCLSALAGTSRRHYDGPAGMLILVNSAGIHRGMPLRRGNRYALTNYYMHPYQIGKTTLDKFAPMMPGTIDRLRTTLGEFT